MTKKHKHIDGQRPLTGLPQAIEAADKNHLPKGMPVLGVLRTELARMGFPAEDADAQYDFWLSRGFRTNKGQLIQDWKAALRMAIRHGYLPSQRKTAGDEDHAKEREARELARLRRIKDGPH
jgi:hypothetical protein